MQTFGRILQKIHKRSPRLKGKVTGREHDPPARNQANSPMGSLHQAATAGRSNLTAQKLPVSIQIVSTASLDQEAPHSL